jgi:proteasome lid subunit RPN8/RPN11
VISAEVLNQISKLAQEAESREVCGYVVRKTLGEVILVPSENKANRPDVSFLISPEAYLEATAQGKLIALYHSHLSGSEKPSESDTCCCNRLQLPFLIYSVERNKFKLIHPGDPLASIIGRPWHYGSCVSAMRDYMQITHGITLPEYAYDTPEEEFPLENRDLFHEGIIASGFIEIKKNGAWSLEDIQRGLLQPSDIISLAILTKMPNSMAVYLGDGKILHGGIKGKALDRTNLTKAYLRRIVHVYRHPKVKHV